MGGMEEEFGPQLRLNREGGFMMRLEEIFFYCADLQSMSANKQKSKKLSRRYKNGIRVLITCMAGMPSRFDEDAINDFRVALDKTNGYESIEELHVALAVRLGAENVFERKKSDVGAWFVKEPVKE